jgi:hypothetical protein
VPHGTCLLPGHLTTCLAWIKRMAWLSPLSALCSTDVLRRGRIVAPTAYVPRCQRTVVLYPRSASFQGCRLKSTQPYIPMPEGRGFTAKFGKVLDYPRTIRTRHLFPPLASYLLSRTNWPALGGKSGENQTRLGYGFFRNLRTAEKKRSFRTVHISRGAARRVDKARLQG